MRSASWGAMTWAAPCCTPPRGPAASASRPPPGRRWHAWCTAKTCATRAFRNPELASVPPGAALPRQVHLVQRDLAHLGLAGFDVGAQQHRRLVATLALDCLEDLGVLVVS